MGKWYDAKNLGTSSFTTIMASLSIHEHYGAHYTYNTYQWKFPKLFAFPYYFNFMEMFALI
jgi:hypothetical protein